MKNSRRFIAAQRAHDKPSYPMSSAAENGRATAQTTEGRNVIGLMLSLSPLGTAVNRHLGSPHNPGQLPVVLMALPVGCLPLATVQAGER